MKMKGQLSEAEMQIFGIKGARQFKNHALLNITFLTVLIKMPFFEA